MISPPDESRGAMEGIMSAKLDVKADAPDALYKRGLKHCVGKGVPVDYVAAHMWFNLAAVRGSLAARERRAELAMDMSAGEIAEAQRQAREWLGTRH